MSLHGGSLGGIFLIKWGRIGIIELRFYPIHIPMLSLQNFTQLSYQEKKSTLIAICTQLDTPQTSFENVIFLLNASNKIQDATLDTIYANLENTRDTARQFQEVELQSQSIQKMLKHDIQVNAEQKDADKILDTI